MALEHDVCVGGGDVPVVDRERACGLRPRPHPFPRCGDGGSSHLPRLSCAAFDPVHSARHNHSVVWAV